MKSLKNNAKNITMDAIIKNLKKEKQKKNSEKIKKYFIKKNFKKNVIFYFVCTIKNHRISRNIIFS